MNTAKMHGLNPQHYFKAVLERISDHPINKITDLLPWNLKTELEKPSNTTVKV
jgi:hypothetical protein